MSHHDFPVLSHLDAAGQVRMVDVGAKPATARVAVCRARVRMGAVAFGLLTEQANGKGEVLNTARVAGVLAAKRCAELIPLCHTLPLSFVGVDFALDAAAGLVEITATCRSDYKTGVEMEAMTACSIAALTVYDMCKAADKGIVLEDVRLLYKAGGKSGEWLAPGLTEPPAAADAAGRADAPRAAVSADGGQACDALPAGEPDGARVCATRPLPEAATCGDAEAPPAARAARSGPGAGGTAPASAAAGARATAATVADADAVVRIVYFARIAELVGQRTESLPWEGPLDGAGLLARLAERHPALGSVGRLKLAVNQRHALHEASIAPGDEVAVFEPVTGG